MLRPKRPNPKPANLDINRPVQARASDQEIKKWVLRNHGFVPASAWIEHCKQLFGANSSAADGNENPCPPEKLPALKQAFRHFGLLQA